MNPHIMTATRAAVSMIFYLKNRDPDNWRDKQDLEHSGPGGGPIPTVAITKDMTAEQAAKIYAQEVLENE